MLLEGFRIPASHPRGAQQIERAQVASLRDLMENVVPQAERFLDASREGPTDVARMRRLFSQAFVSADETINAGRDLGAISFESATAMSDLVTNLRAEAGHRVKHATELMETGLNEVDSTLPAFATDARNRLKWIRGFAAELAGDRLQHDEKLEL